MRKPVPTYTLSELREQQSSATKIIGRIASKVIGQYIPDFENAAEVVEAAVDVVRQHPSRLGNAVQDSAEAVEAAVCRALRPRKVDLSIGKLICVREAARYDVAEVLERARTSLERRNLKLVQPGLLFGEVRYNYEWNGRLIEFYPAEMGSGLQVHYLAIDNDLPEERPKSSQSLTVVQSILFGQPTVE